MALWIIVGLLIGLVISIGFMLGSISGTIEKNHKEKIQLLKDNEYARQQQADNHFTEMMDMIDCIRRSQ